MTSPAHLARIAAGVAVLVALIVLGAMLTPPYFENMRFQRYLDTVVERNVAPDVLRAEIVNKAAQLGLPLHSGDIHITRSGNGIQVDIIDADAVDEVHLVARRRIAQQAKRRQMRCWHRYLTW